MKYVFLIIISVVTVVSAHLYFHLGLGEDAVVHEVLYNQRIAGYIKGPPFDDLFIASFALVENNDLFFTARKAFYDFLPSWLRATVKENQQNENQTK